MNENSLSREAPVPVQDAAGQQPGGGDFYVGNDICRSCHEGFFEKWDATKHSSSYSTLAATGHEKDPSCLRCHTTGYREPHGFTEVEATPELASVGCEACHGPSGDHARSRFPGLVRTGSSEDCGDCEVSRICRQCHTRRQSPGFVVAAGLAKVSCSRPGNADAGSVKGE